MRLFKLATTAVFCSRACAILTAGLLTGVLQVVLSTSYATLIYGGKLSPYLSQGIGLALLGALIIATIISLFTSLPGTVGSNQDVTVAIFSLISVSIVASMPTEAPLENVFYTVVTTIALTVFLTGLFLFVLGSFRLGGLVRYLPYPVIGGFLAGTGWLLFTGGFSIVSGGEPFSDLWQPLSMAHWLPSLIYSVIMLIIVHRSKSKYTLPGLILAGFLIFYAIAWYSGKGLGEIYGDGWLLGPFPDGILMQSLNVTNIHEADWHVIVGQISNISAILVVSAVALLLNASAFEVETKQDINLDKELQLAGIANFFSSFSPGFVGFRQVAISILNFRIGAQSRLVGLIGVFVVAITLFFGAPVISYFPKFVMGALLMYLGLTFLVEWGYKTWFTLPRVDFAIIWMVLVVIAAIGFMSGVVVGLVAALIMFVVSTSRTEVVSRELTGKTYQSQTTQDTTHNHILSKHGDQLYILQLQGFIFFGTAHRLLRRIKQKMNGLEGGQIGYIILDFDQVDILDSTGIQCFIRLSDFLCDFQAHLLITSPFSVIEQQLAQGGLNQSRTSVSYFDSLQDGVEWCEREIHKKEGCIDHQQSSHIRLHDLNLSPLTSSHISSYTWNDLFNYLERIEIAQGDTIIDKDNNTEHLYFLESGQIATKVSDNDGLCVHRNNSKKECIIGGTEFYLGQKQTTDIVAAKRCIVYRLSIKKLQQIEKKKPEIASLIHHSMARMLADRVTHLSRTLKALHN